ncbi:hypothetical protein D3C75_868430 [compost metagenome]
MVALVFVDENPEELVQRCGLHVHGRAEVVIAVDDFAVQAGAQAGLLHVPHADGFQVGPDAYGVDVDFQIRAHADFQPGLFVDTEIARLNSAIRVQQQFPGGRVLVQRFLNGQRCFHLLLGHQNFVARVLAPGIQQFVSKHGIRLNGLHRLDHLCFGAGHF